ncbi:hypothetical protein CPC08DRAFT_815585 [Agrocybe pediades]|nr:hypothetical protein CPC08DRAFT_815585 [Agrocybe pediades]
MNIARLYHPAASCTPLGHVNSSIRTAIIESNFSNNRNTLIAVSNPNGEVVKGTNSQQRPVMSKVPTNIGFDVTIPMNLKASSIKVARMELGFSSHALRASSRLVFVEARLA